MRTGVVPVKRILTLLLGFLIPAEAAGTDTTGLSEQHIQPIAGNVYQALII